MTEAGLFPDGLLAGRPRGERYGVATLPPPPVYVAHRGEPLVAPQNTVAAFRSAAERGVPVIETDVVPTLDGTLVVTHDTELSLYYDVSGDIREMPLSDVLRARSRHAEFTDQHPPLLSDILSGPGRVVWHVEAKSGGAATLARIAEEIVRYGVQRQVAASCTISIGANAFEAVHAAYPMVYLIGISFDGANAPNLSALAAAGVSAIAVPHNASWLSSSFVEQAHAAGLPVIVWTVNTRADRDRVLAAGPDMIYTDNWPWVSGAVEPAALPLSDSLKRTVVGTQWTAQAGSAFAWTMDATNGAGISGTDTAAHLILVGAMIPESDGCRIEVTFTPRDLNTDATRWIGVQFCLQTDLPTHAFGPVPSSFGGGYGAVYRQNGRIQIDRYDPGQQLTILAGNDEGAPMVDDTPVKLRIDIKPSEIVFALPDSEDAVSTEDTTYRGGFCALIVTRVGGDFTDFSITALEEE